MKWVPIIVIIYLWVVVWVQVDNSYRRFKEAVFNTFVYPWIYFFLGVPYYIWRGIRYVALWVWNLP